MFSNIVMTNRVLFICTGNYYRSRFAEAFFNHHAELCGLEWRAFSRGLAIYLAPDDPLSAHTSAALIARSIDFRHTGVKPVQISEADLLDARLVIALHDFEHRPMIRAQFPEWIERVSFWNVPDLPFIPAVEAVPLIEERVVALLNSLRSPRQGV